MGQVVHVCTKLVFSCWEQAQHFVLLGTLLGIGACAVLHRYKQNTWAQPWQGSHFQLESTWKHTRDIKAVK